MITKIQSRATANRPEIHVEGGYHVAFRAAKFAEREESFGPLAVGTAKREVSLLYG
jgi:hypothetical protein